MEENGIGLSNDALAASTRRSVREKWAKEVGGGSLAGPERIEANVTCARVASEEREVASRLAELAVFELVGSR